MLLIRILVVACTLAATPAVRDAVVVAPVGMVTAAPIAMRGDEALTAAKAKPDHGDDAADALQARVEIGPAVLRLYDDKGNVIAIE